MKIAAKVISTKAKRSPLVQGGLQIPINVTVIWDNKKSLRILKDKVETVQYPVRDLDYTDDTKEILK